MFIDTEYIPNTHSWPLNNSNVNWPMLCKVQLYVLWEQQYMALVKHYMQYFPVFVKIYAQIKV